MPISIIIAVLRVDCILWVIGPQTKPNEGEIPMSTITRIVAIALASAIIIMSVQPDSVAQTIDSCTVSESCDDCQSGMGACGCHPEIKECGCRPCWAHRIRLFGEFLYLRAGDGDIAYAAEVDGVVSPPLNQGLQLGPIGIVEQQYEPAYRAGFGFALNPCASIGGSYTNFQSHAVDAVTRTGENVIRSLVTHPLVNNAAADWLDANASHDIDFQLADMEYRRLIFKGPNHAVNFLAGGRYAHMDQDFRSLFSGNGTRSLDTDISFDGGGIRVGTDFNVRAPCFGLYVYGLGSGSFLASSFGGSYRQGTDFDPVEVNTSIEDHRIVSILDLELGIGWEGYCGRLRIGAGYLVSAWFNTINTDSLIAAVNANNFRDIGGETTTFDGLTAHAEYRF